MVSGPTGDASARVIQRHRGMQWGLGIALLLLVVAMGAWSGAGREVLGAMGVPGRCVLSLDGTLAPAEFRIEYVRRDEPRDVRKQVFDGARCRAVPGQNGETAFYIGYRGELVCVAAYFRAIDYAFDTYRFKCSDRTGRVICSAELNGSPVPTSCHGWPHSEEPAF